MKEKILVAMSGGVDSAVAAHLIHAEGQDACGVTMKLLCGAGVSSCTTDEDIAAACRRSQTRRAVMKGGAYAL